MPPILHFAIAAVALVALVITIVYIVAAFVDVFTYQPADVEAGDHR